MVTIPTAAGPVSTIREIEQQPDTPAGKFYLRAVNTNGIDSRQFGAVPKESIRAKVFWVARGA
jgi:hypothetical protein